MLTSARWGIAAATSSAALVLAMWQATMADAGNPSDCTRDPSTHIVQCTTPPVATTESTSPPSSSGSAPPAQPVDPKCYYYSIEVPCSGPDGWWWDSDTTVLCWIGPPDTLQGVPARKDNEWLYKAYCPAVTWTKQDPVGSYTDIYLPNPPPQQPSPIELAKQAAATIKMSPPAIGIAPTHEGSGLVGMPVWMWTVQFPDTWGTHKSAPATAPGLWVVATATAKSITWDMGDGHTVTCGNPGTAYVASYGLSSSPDCGYTYTQPSGGKPGGVYTVTGTTTWEVTWVASTGQAGTLPPVTADSTTTVKIGELQAVN